MAKNKPAPISPEDEEKKLAESREASLKARAAKRKSREPIAQAAAKAATEEMSGVYKGAPDAGVLPFPTDD